MNLNDDELLEKFTPEARWVLLQAQEGTTSVVTPTQFLSSLLDNGGDGVWRDSLESIGVELETLREHAAVPTIFRPAWMPKEGDRPQPNNAGEELIELTLREAERLGQAQAGCEALLLGLISQRDEYASRILVSAGADLERTHQEVERLLGRKIILRSMRNLTQAAIDGELDPIIGRDREIERLLHILFRNPSKIPVLVGRAHVGKTSVVYGFAQRIAANKVPEAFVGTQVFQLDLRTAARRANTRDELESLLSQVLTENLTQRDVILFLDDEQLMQFPLPRKLRIIGTVKASHMPHALSHPPPVRFVPITIEEVSVQQTIQILESRRARIEDRYQVTVADRVLEAVAQYANERLDGPLPGSAFDLLDEAASLGGLRGLRSVDEKTVTEAIAGMLGVAPEEIEKASPVQAPTAKVEHDPEIWEMS